MNYLSLNIRHLRKLKKLTQLQLADEIGTNRTNIATWEKTLKNFSVDYLIAFSKYFDISIDDFILKDLSKEGYSDADKVPDTLNEKSETYNLQNSKQSNLNTDTLLIDVQNLTEALKNISRSQSSMSELNLKLAQTIENLREKIRELEDKETKK